MLTWWTDSDWEDRWSLLAFCGAIVGIVLLVVLACSNKQVDGYYISAAEHKAGFCVYAHWTWHTDELAYCSDDKDKVLEFAAKANALVRK